MNPFFRAKHSGSSEDSDTGHTGGKLSSDKKTKADDLKGNKKIDGDKTSTRDIENDDNQNNGAKHKDDSEFNGEAKTDVTGRPKQKAVLKSDVEEPLEISDKHVKGRGYKRTRGDRDGKHSEGKTHKSEKSKKHKHSGDSSSESSSSRSSQSFSESESDDSKEHHMNGYRLYTGSDIGGDINDLKGIQKHGHDNIRGGWDDNDKQLISVGRKRHGAEKFRAYPGDGSEKAVMRNGKIVRGHGYKRKRDRLKDKSENVTAGTFVQNEKEIKAGQSTSSSSSGSSSSRSSSESEAGNKRQPFAGDDTGNNIRYDKIYNREYPKGYDESYDRGYDGGYAGMHGRGYDSRYGKRYGQIYDDNYVGVHDKIHDDRNITGYDRIHDDRYGRGHGKIHDDKYVYGRGYKTHDVMGNDNRHDDRYFTGYDKQHDNKYVKEYDQSWDGRYIKGNDKTHDDRYVKGYDRSHHGRFDRKYDDRYDRFSNREYDDGRYNVGDESDLRHYNIEPHDDDIERNIMDTKHVRKTADGKRGYKTDAHVKNGLKDMVIHGNGKYTAAHDDDLPRHLNGDSKGMQRNRIKQIRADIKDGFQGKVKRSSKGVGGHGYQHEKERFDDGIRMKGGSEISKRTAKRKKHEGIKTEREGTIEDASDKSMSAGSSGSLRHKRISKRTVHQAMKKDREGSFKDASDKSMSDKSSESSSQKETGLKRQILRDSSTKYSSDRSKSNDQDKDSRHYDVETSDGHVGRELRGFKSKGKKIENLHKGKTKGSKKISTKDDKKYGHQNGSASQDNYFEEVSATDSEDEQNLRLYRSSPEVAFEGAVEIGPDGHVKGHGFRRSKEGQSYGVEDKEGKGPTRQKHMKSKPSKVDSDKDSSSSSVDYEHSHDYNKFRTPNDHFEEVTEADNVGIGGFTALEKASKLDTTGLHGNRNAAFGAENIQKRKSKGSKKNHIGYSKGHNQRRSTAGEDDYFEDVSATDTVGKQKQRRPNRVSPDVAFEGAVEIGSEGHIKGHGYMRTKDRQSNDSKNKQKYAGTGHKHLKSKASKDDSGENSSGSIVDTNNVEGYDNDKFGTRNNYSEGDTKAYSEDIGGLTGLEKASKLDTTGLHGDRNAFLGAEDDREDNRTKAWSKRGKGHEKMQQSKTDHENIRHDGESLVGNQTDTRSVPVKSQTDKRIKEDHDTGEQKTYKHGSKKEKSKRDKQGRGDNFKDGLGEKSSSSSSESSSSSSDSDTDFSREEIIDDGRIYTIRVESSSDDDNENIRKHRTVFYNAKDHKYSEGYIPKDKHKESVSNMTSQQGLASNAKSIDKTSPQGLASKGKSSEHTGNIDANDLHQIKDRDSKVKFDDQIFQNNVDAAQHQNELKRKYDDSIMKTDPMTLEEIKEFKDSNMEDIGNVMKFIKSIDTFGPRESSRRGFTGGQTSSLITYGRQNVNKIGMKDSSVNDIKDAKGSRSKYLKDNDYKLSDGNKENEQFLPRLDPGQFKQGSKGKHFLEHLIETESDDSRQRNLVDYNKFAKTDKSSPRKLLRRGKIKSPYVSGNKGILRKKVKGISNKDATIFRGSRVNPAFRKSIRQSPRGKRIQDNKETNMQDSKGNKGLNIAQTTNGDIEGKYLQNFRGISNGGLSGRSIEKDGDKLKEKPGVSKDTGR